ncbi:MAG: adaptor protein MecA [Clostridia bacterium]|nr:adaptor protein MecA [Clostridia bacterium]
MELILINNTKLKIMLTADEVRQYDIDREGEGGCDMRRTFAPVLDRARERCGFDASAGRVFIQLFPSREGGCEMFVTKLPSPPSGPEQTGARQKSVTPDVAQSTPYDGDYELPDSAEAYFGFDTVGGLVSGCRLIRAAGEGEGSRAYLTDGGRFLLRVSGKTERAAGTAVGEFARREARSAMLIYIPEHCRRIVNDPACTDDAAFLGSF